MIKKVCKGCEVRKGLSEFPKNKRMVDGTINKCKDCINEYMQIRAKNKARTYPNSLVGRVNRGSCIKEHSLMAKHGIDVTEMLLKEPVSSEDVMYEINGYRS